MHLGLGLHEGLDMIGESSELVVMDTIDTIDPTRIDASDVVVLPSWIGRRAFEVNLEDIRSACGPSTTIVVYTGTSPYYSGCPWVDHDLFTGELNLGSEASEEVKSRLDAIDMFATVWSERPAADEVQVGMGHASDPNLVPTPGSSHIVILDHLKVGWDEDAFTEACLGLKQVKHPMHLVVLGDVACKRAADLGLDFSKGFPEHTPFEAMCSLYQSASAMIIHNESFGYPIVEASCCGTQVLSSRSSDIPNCHSSAAKRWFDIDDLATKVDALLEMDPARLADDVSARCKSDPKWSTFWSWEATARKIMTAVERSR